MKKTLLVITVLSGALLWGSSFAQDTTTASDPAVTPQVPTVQPPPTPESSLQKLKQLAAQLKQSDQNQAPTTSTTAQTTPMANAAPASNMGDTAFAGVLSKRLPLTPEQIQMLYEAFLQARQAAAAPPGVPPRPAITSLPVNLAPSSTPPIIRLQGGYITTLVFVDATGQPWPIEYYSIGDPSSFYIPSNTINLKDGDNILPIQAKSFNKRSNLIVHLKDLDTPIMLTLLTGQKAVDYRVDLRIPGIGPNAILQTQGLPSFANPLLLNVLNGLPPTKNARDLKALGYFNTQAWLANDMLFLRTPLELISPGWSAKMTSIDGTNAYELPPASVLLAVQHGHETPIQLRLPDLRD